MASLLARHQTSCAAYPGKESAFEGATATNGCTCKPTYYAVMHLKQGGRVNVGKNRNAAKTALRKLQNESDAGHEFTKPTDTTFREWVAQWQASLTCSENTKRSYVATVDYAIATFGNKRVRSISTADVLDFVGRVKAPKTKTVGTGEQKRTVTKTPSRSTVSKHLRVLTSIMAAAVAAGYATANPVSRLPKQQRPKGRVRGSESPYFTDDEIARLFAGGDPPTVRPKDAPLFRLALQTGMRQGELLGLQWGDVDLGNAKIRVRRHYVAGLGLEDGAKTEKGQRDVDLAPETVTFLGELWGAQDKPGADRLVFPGKDGEPRHNSNLTRQLYKAMDRAGIDRVGPTDEERTFHSFRHTYGRIAMENGVQLKWLQKQLGHATFAMTADLYAHFGDEASKQQAGKLSGAFSA